MADSKISGMTPGSVLDGTELLEMTQSGSTFSTTTQAIKDLTYSSPVVLTELVGDSALTLTGATQTVSHPVFTATQTWNAIGVTFTAWKLNVTSTASAAASLLMDLQVGGSSKLTVGKGGDVVAAATVKTGGYTVSTLPTGVVGMQTYVTDSNATLTAGIGATVAGSGANIVPVFFDGTNWKIG